MKINSAFIRWGNKLPGRSPTEAEAEKFNLTYCETHFIQPLEQGQTAEALLKASETEPDTFLTTLFRMIEQKVTRIQDVDVIRRYLSAYSQYVEAAKKCSTVISNPKPH